MNKDLSILDDVKWQYGMPCGAKVGDRAIFIGWLKVRVGRYAISSAAGNWLDGKGSTITSTLIHALIPKSALVQIGGRHDTFLNLLEACQAFVQAEKIYEECGGDTCDWDAAQGEAIEKAEQAIKKATILLGKE